MRKKGWRKSKKDKSISYDTMRILNSRIKEGDYFLHYHWTDRRKQLFNLFSGCFRL